MRSQWTEMSADDHKGSAARILPCLTLLAAAAHACFAFKNNSGLWMLMLSINNKYFIGSVYAAMLWSFDVAKPFDVNFFDAQKKNLYRWLFCGWERDETWMSRAGAGPDETYFCGRGIESCGSVTEKSVLRRSLVWICMSLLCTGRCQCVKVKPDIFFY